MPTFRDKDGAFQAEFCPITESSYLPKEPSIHTRPHPNIKAQETSESPIDEVGTEDRREKTQERQGESIFEQHA